MRASQRSSGSNLKTKRYVKNKLMIGDATPYGTRKMDSGSFGARRIETNSQAATANMYLDYSGKADFRSQDGVFKKEIRARSPRATEIYGSKRKAMKNSYEKTVRDPTKTKGTNTKKTASESGGLTSKRKSSRPRNKGLI